MILHVHTQYPCLISYFGMKKIEQAGYYFLSLLIRVNIPWFHILEYKTKRLSLHMTCSEAVYILKEMMGIFYLKKILLVGYG